VVGHKLAFQIGPQTLGSLARSLKRAWPSLPTILWGSFSKPVILAEHFGNCFHILPSGLQVFEAASLAEVVLQLRPSESACRRETEGLLSEDDAGFGAGDSLAGSVFRSGLTPKPSHARDLPDERGRVLRPSIVSLRSVQKILHWPSVLAFRGFP
jgi:hypothetical protein